MTLYDADGLRRHDVSLIECSLKVVDLDHPPEYYCLSYTWGAPAKYGPLGNSLVCPILCNGEVLHVTENLYCFLRRLRDLSTLCHRTFWIDAICVNQQDKKERSDQVRLMADIYTSASMVVSWLGEEDKHTQPGFVWLRKLKAVSDHSPHNLSRLANFAPDSWLSVANIFQRTYFTRAWIIQEVVLAKAVKVLCGRQEIEWSAIAEASHFLSTLFLDRGEFQLGTEEFLGTHTLLLYLLIKARSFEATDPRDKVYSLLGLVHDYARCKPGLAPSYKADETQAPAIAYIRAAIDILEDSDDLLLLSCVEGEAFQKLSTGPLPSWVPDWSAREPTGLRVTGYERYSTSMSLKQQAHIDKTSLTLSLRGIKLDYVTMVGEAKRDVLLEKPFPKWLEIIETLETRYGPARNEHKLDVLWRTLIVNTAGCPPELVSKTPQVSEFVRPFTLSQHLRLFRTNEGYLGLGSECLQAGDSVWIVPGSRVPLILRPHKVEMSSANRCRLVGGTYLHGFMEGAAVSPAFTGKTMSEIEASMEAFVLV
ncbi:HET-domain-containing protein [Coniochaeta ligniaria NRRL 30616]|uniref:HET-domain-containing protein n=1 Tax=Coniochaeta ligniaria NRRL 30616 TaxID=1408157 RepID=A0A1J7J9Z9_9PEZI|nr:HET-domain-containing protein [Coniochaeta ligniaria NRRL 30616]